MADPVYDVEVIVRALVQHEVDFIVVGGVCAVLQGVPLATFDMDLVHSREPDNLSRLLAALQSLGAYYRGQGDRRIKPTIPHLASPGHQLLMTNAGPLDVFGTITGDLTYEDLLPNTSRFEVVDGLWVTALNLETLIETKEAAGRDKDKFALPVLRRTLEERNKGRPSESS